jgi:uncharacterized protein (DUF2384 family)
MHPRKVASEAPDRGAVLTQAVVRAAANLGLSHTVLGRTLGLSQATVSRMCRGTYVLAADDKPFELAALFVRVYRSLDAVVGGDDTVAAAWLANDNLALKNKPLDLIQTVAGLTYVLQYLDTRRAVS